jgi:hypothetical protein
MQLAPLHQGGFEDEGQLRGVQGKAVQVDPIKPNLKLPGTKRLTLKCDEQLSHFAFEFNLRRYTKLACLSTTIEMQRRLDAKFPENKVHFVAADPGFVASDIWQGVH